MELFGLPNTTRVNKVIPKNSFDKYTSKRQRKKFTDTVTKISWTNKLAVSTTNLSGRGVKEIQVFHIELKQHKNIDDLLELVERAIPYNVVYVVTYQEFQYFFTSYKRIHSTNEDCAVVDFVFKTGWQKKGEAQYVLNLTENLDTVFFDFCKQLCDQFPDSIATLPELVAYQRKKQVYIREISRLKASIIREIQFSKKVELNIMLNKLSTEYQKFLESQ